MVSKSLHIFLKAISIVSFITMALIIAIISWIVIEPRSLEDFEPFIKDELASVSGEYKIDFENSYIKWNEYHKAISIFIENAKIINKNSETVASLPETYFNFSVLNFLKGKLLSSDVHIYNPNIYANIDIHKNKELENKTIEKNVILSKAYKIIYSTIESYTPSFSLNELRAYNVSIFLKGGISENAWNVKEGFIYAENDTETDTKIIKSELLVDFNGADSHIKTEISILEKEQRPINISLFFDNLSSLVLNDLFPESETLKKFSIQGNSIVKTELYPNGDLAEIDLYINNAKGVFNFPKFFPNEIVIDKFYANATLSKENIFTISDSNIKIANSDINISGKISNLGAILNKEDSTSYPEMELDISANKIKVNEVQNLWAFNLGPSARKWVTNHMKNGEVTSASLKIKLTEKDFSSLKQWKIVRDLYNINQKSKPTLLDLPLPNDAIQARLKVENTEIDYHDLFPKVHDINAEVFFTAHDMKAKISSAKLLESEIRKGEVNIPSFWLNGKDKLRLDIKGNTNGKISNYLEFLKAVNKNENNDNVLESVYNSSGLIDGEFSLSFPTKKKLSLKQLNLAIKANASDIKLPNFLNGKDLTKSNFKIDLYNNKLNLEGSSFISEIPIDFSYQQSFHHEKSKSPIKYKVKANISAEELRELGVADLIYIKNPFLLEAEVEKYGDKRKISLNADISNSVVNIPEISFNKKENVAGKLKAEIITEETNIKVTSFDLTGEEYKLSGLFEIEKGELKKLNIIEAKYDNNDYTLNLNTSNKIKNINIYGKQFDASEISTSSLKAEQKNSENKTNNRDNWKNFILKVKLDSLLMRNKTTYKSVDAYVNCKNNKCKKIQFFAEIPENKGFATIDIKPINDRNSTILIESDNAGYVLKGLGISKNINDGHLLIQGSASFPRNKPSTTTGLLKISNFTAKQTPMLGKLLTVASLKGITDILNNKGISFDTFEAPFILSNYIIDIKDAKSSGSSLGITAEGSIDFRKQELSLKGTIIPAQTLNKIINKIPVVGNLITGGKDQGLIATSYSIKGPMNNIKTSVNPLSIFTPGVLRNLFDLEAVKN